MGVRTITKYLPEFGDSQDASGFPLSQKGGMMEKKDSSKLWIPLWVDKILYGSTNFELTLDQQAVWIKLLCLGAKDNGFIRANVDLAYPTPALAGLLLITEEVLSRTIEKCIEVGKIEKFENGTLFIKNWDEYQLSERHRRRFDQFLEKEGSVSAKSDITSGNPDITSGKADAIIEKSIVENNIEKKKKEEKIRFDEDQRIFLNISLKDISTWTDAYPACDIESELNKMIAWLIAHPDQRKSNYPKFINSWLSRSQDRGGTNRFLRGESFSKTVGQSRRRAPDAESFFKERAEKEKELISKFGDDKKRIAEELAKWSEERGTK